MSSGSASDSLLDREALSRKIAGMADELAARARTPEDCALVGIRTRGATLARRLHNELKRQQGWDVPLGALDITLYRDDLSRRSEQPLVQATEIDFDIEGKLIFLVDDVLYTGRTIRSALDALLEFGRPRRIMLAVLVDRGLREFPIQPDFAGLTIETDPDQIVRVCFDEDDAQEGVLLEQRPAA